MRYITGTCFTVKDIRVLRTVRSENIISLKPGTYTILTIRKKDSKIEYNLTEGKAKFSVVFENTEEADKFIALCRGERYP